MPKNAWGDEIATQEDPRSWGDQPAAQRELPADVTPSTAGGGRGKVNPPTARDRQIAEMDAATDPTNPDYDVRSVGAGVDAKRTRSPGRVLDADIPPVSLGSAARDVASGALQIGPTAVKGVGDILRLASADTVGKGITEFAERGNRAIQEVVGSQRSQAQRTRFQQDMADPALNAADVVAGNPGALADQVLPTVGSMALPVGAAAGANALATGSRAAKVAAAIDPSTVATRAATATGAAVLGTTVAQNAGDTFSTVRDRGGDLKQAYLAAAITAPTTYLASRLSGGGAEGAVARGMTGQAGQRSAAALPKAMAREGGQEGGEQLGQSVGEAVAMGDDLDPQKISKEIAVASTLGAVVGGAVDLPAAVKDTVKRLRASGDSAAADLIERQATEKIIPVEIEKMGDAAAHPAFQAAYRANRSEGLKPAEAAARAGMATGFQELATATGISDKAVAKATEAAKKLPLDKVPGFLDKFTAALIRRGMGTPLPDGTVAGAVGALRDDAMKSVTETFYADTPDDIAAAINQLEQKQSPAKIESAEAGVGAGGNSTAALPPVTVPASAFDPGDDIAMTPEAGRVHTAATSPLNDLPEPTDAQKAAGNYKVGRLRIAGMDISVENPQGSTRRGTDADGKPWETTMRVAHYGYFKGTTANDGDKLDVFVKPGTPEDYRGPVFVVDQVDPATGKLDEHKVILGAADEAEAEAMYRANYDAGWQGLGAITRLPLPAFKAWAKSGALKEPLGDITQAEARAAAQPQPAAPVPAPAADPAAAQLQPATGDPAVEAGTAGQPDAALTDKPAAKVRYGRNGTPLDEGGKPFKTKLQAVQYQKKYQPQTRIVKAGDGFALIPRTDKELAAQAENGKRRQKAARMAAWEKNPLMVFLASNGVSINLASEFAPGPTERRRAMVPGYGPVFRRDGLNTDLLAELAAQDGFLPPGSRDADAMAKLIARAFGGQRVAPVYAEGAAEQELERRVSEAPEAVTPEEMDAIADLSELRENELDAIEDLVDDVPDLTAQSNTSTEDAMRAIGFSEQEIINAKNRQATQESAGPPADGERIAQPAEAAQGEAPRADRGRESPANAPAVDPPQTPADAGVSASGITWELRDTGTLAIKGDQTAILDKLNAGGITKTMPMQGGIMVGKTQAKKALAILEGQPEQAKAKPLSVGIAPGNAEPVTVRDGVVFIGADEALDFDTGEPVTVPNGASQDTIKQALRDAGALSKRQKFFGGIIQGQEQGQPAPVVREPLSNQEQKDNGSALTDRFAAGKALTKDQRKQVLGTLVDVYKVKDAPREQKGIGPSGNERYGYVHSPDLFEKSDITGAMVRYYVTLPDGRIAHPSELFPDFTQAQIDTALIEQANDERREKEGQAFAERQADTGARASPAEADAAFMQRNRNFELRDWRTGKTRSFVHFEKDGRFYSVLNDDAAMMRRIEKAGWKRTDALTAPTEAEVLAQQQRAADGEKAEAQRKKDDEARAKADAELGEFTLTGSDRPADVAAAAGQSGLFDTLDALSGIYKAVRGRAGMNADRSGPLDYVRGHITRYAERIKMLNDAKDATEKTKRVPTGFAMDAKRIDQGAVTDYWTTEHEMGARAFSAYVEDKLAADDRASYFLSYGSDNNLLQYRLFNIRPFPEGQEREAINAGFDRFFKALQVKETDTGTALFSRRNDTPVTIPPVVIGSTLGTATTNPDYPAAKTGDVEAAARLANTMITPGLVARTKELLGNSKPVLIPVAGMEAGSLNMIPQAAATALAKKLGLTVNGDIVQVMRAERTTLQGLDRVFRQPEFDGPVEAGQEYLLVDDTLTQGGTFAALASHIRQGGGKVVGAIALTGKQYSATMQPSSETIRKLRAKHGDIETDFRAATGYGFDALTESEARYLAAYEPAQAIRDRVAAQLEQRRADEAGQVALSRGAPGSGLTPAQFTAELAQAFGPKVAERLQSKGVVVPLADQNSLPAHVVPFLRDGDVVFGFYDPRTNRIAAAKRGGHDGAIVTYDDFPGETAYVAFKPDQIKSAFNRGTFDPKDPDIRFSRTQNLFEPDGWSAPEPTKTDRVIYELQNKTVDLKRVQQAITAARGAIDQKFDAQLAETLYPGRVARRTDLFLDREVKPLLEAMAKSKATMDELADYLIARHAPERNAQVAKVNPDLPDGGAGRNSKGELMTNDAAAAYMAGIPAERRAELAALAEKVDAITAGTRGLLVAEGLEKAETVAAWQGAYKNYVPLFKDEAEHPHPQGTGFNVRGPASKRSTGSTKQVTNVIAHVLMQREAAITRAEKNRVGLALYGLALSNPNREFWTTIKPGMTNEAIGRELEDMGVDPEVAVTGMQRVPTIRTVDPLTQKVVDRPNPIYKSMPGAITLKVNGEDRVLLINTKTVRGLRMAEALKNLDGMTNFNLAGMMVGKVTRWMAAISTQYNPAFGLVNLVRDTLGGAVNIGSTKLRGKGLKVLADVPMAMQGIARELAGGGETSEWSKLWKQFQDDGGRTGFREVFAQAQDRADAIERELKAAQAAGKLTAGKVGHAALDLLDGFNTTLENAVRLAAYKHALDIGMSRAEAARLGRELTVDFNRKGRLGRELGPLYAFFNASVQGGARTLETLRGPTGAKVIAGGLALGAMQAMMLLAAGYDDDEIPEFVKTRALIIPLFGEEKKFIAIPYPPGLHVIPNTGRVMTELSLNGGKNAGRRAFNAVGEIAAAFNPLGGGNIFTADGFLKTVAPTIVDPVIEWTSNKNFMGTPIERESRGETDNRPGYQRAKEATLRSTTGQAYLGISKAINWATGGTAYEKGLASPTPEMVRYIAQTAGGGVLRELEKTVDSSVKAMTGEKVKKSGIPIVGRFYGEVDDDQVQASRYYEKAKDLDRLQSSQKAAQTAGDGAAMTRIIEDNPELALARSFDQVQREIAKLNKAAISTVDDPATIKAIDQARVEAMRGLNDAVKAMEQAEGKLTPGQRLKAAMGR
jgi:hypothetical protein